MQLRRRTPLHSRALLILYLPRMWLINHILHNEPANWLCPNLSVALLCVWSWALANLLTRAALQMAQDAVHLWRFYDPIDGHTYHAPFPVRRSLRYSLRAISDFAMRSWICFSREFDVMVHRDHKRIWRGGRWRGGPQGVCVRPLHLLPRQTRRAAQMYAIQYNTRISLEMLLEVQSVVTDCNNFPWWLIYSHWLVLTEAIIRRAWVH